MLTRSKTGSLTPKLFTDSITMTTTSMKTTGKSTEEVVVVNKDGEVTKMSRGKISVTSSLAQQSLYFKLGTVVFLINLQVLTFNVFRFKTK